MDQSKRKGLSDNQSMVWCMGSDRPDTFSRRDYLSASGTAMTGILTVLAGCSGSESGSTSPANDVTQTVRSTPSDADTSPNPTQVDLYSGTFTETSEQTTRQQRYQTQPRQGIQPSPDHTTTENSHHTVNVSTERNNKSPNPQTTLQITNNGEQRGSYTLIVDDPNGQVVEGGSQIQTANNTGCENAFTRFSAKIPRGFTQAMEFSGSITKITSQVSITLALDVKESNINTQYGTIDFRGMGHYSFEMTGSISPNNSTMGRGDTVTGPRSATGLVDDPDMEYFDKYKAYGRLGKLDLEAVQKTIEITHEYDTRPCPYSNGT